MSTSLLRSRSYASQTRGRSNATGHPRHTSPKRTSSVTTNSPRRSNSLVTNHQSSRTKSSGLVRIPNPLPVTQPPLPADQDKFSSRFPGFSCCMRPPQPSPSFSGHRRQLVLPGTKQVSSRTKDIPATKEPTKSSPITTSPPISQELPPNRPKMPNIKDRVNGFLQQLSFGGNRSSNNEVLQHAPTNGHGKQTASTKPKRSTSFKDIIRTRPVQEPRHKPAHRISSTENKESFVNSSLNG